VECSNLLGPNLKLVIDTEVESNKLAAALTNIDPAIAQRLAELLTRIEKIPRNENTTHHGLLTAGSASFRGQYTQQKPKGETYASYGYSGYCSCHMVQLSLRDRKNGVRWNRTLLEGETR
jgi:hypothetical protein